MKEGAKRGIDSEAIITVTDKVLKYKGQRREHAEKLRTGMSVAEFKEGGGDMGFLRFYIKDAAVTVK